MDRVGLILVALTVRLLGGLAPAVATSDTRGESAVYVVAVRAPVAVGTVDWRWPALALGVTLAALVGWARH